MHPLITNKLPYRFTKWWYQVQLLNSLSKSCLILFLPQLRRLHSFAWILVHVQIAVFSTALTMPCCVSHTVYSPIDQRCLANLDTELSLGLLVKSFCNEFFHVGFKCHLILTRWDSLFIHHVRTKNFSTFLDETFSLFNT